MQSKLAILSVSLTNPNRASIHVLLRWLATVEVEAAVAEAMVVVAVIEVDEVVVSQHPMQLRSGAADGEFRHNDSVNTEEVIIQPGRPACVMP